MKFPPTPEQQAIIDAAVTSPDNLLVSALAGAAKTSTLILIAEALPDVQILCLAFNKKIAEEMAAKLPTNCTSKTLNSLGLAVWKDMCTGKVIVDLNKAYRLVRAEIDHLDGDDRTEAFKEMAAIMDSFRHAKSAGHIPDSCAVKNTRLMNDKNMLDSLEEEPSPLHERMLLSMLSASCREALSGRVDFDDMLLMPTCFRASFPRFQLILVDETQDLSPLNHAMLKKLVRKRIIAVGDQCQAIYGFRGASESGMDDMKEHFDMATLHLTTSFRCPQEIVDHVLWRAPEMKAWPSTPAGSITTKTVWDLSDIPTECAILCRNNAPLYRLAISLFAGGRAVNLWGSDITKGLLKILKGFGAGNMEQEQVLECVNQWEHVKLAKAKQTGPILDRAECLRILARAAPTLAEAMTHAEELSANHATINLMTVHKSKGHEFENVIMLDEQLIGDEGQEANIRYVGVTRTQRHLTYLTSDGRITDETE